MPSPRETRSWQCPRWCASCRRRSRRSLETCPTLTRCWSGSTCALSSVHDSQSRRGTMTAIQDKTKDKQQYVLRLYVTGATVLSRRAIVNINAICKEHLQGRYDLEVIDIHQNPALARAAQL